ncbi:hypothetical protein D5086_032698 [Populus alba]|uniref:Uncharacterized protein n=1 Tax=Populus alba TaxID=43335 RepID=A0ACC4AFJ7_POPAL
MIDGDDEVVFVSQERHAPLYLLETCVSDHMILSYELIFVNQLRKYSGNEVTFKFHHREGNNMARKVRHEIRRPVGLKSCGVYLHFDENPSADTDGYRYLPIVIGYRAANAERAVINPPAKSERRRWSLKDVFVVIAEKE